MDFSNRKQALLYLERNGFYFYESGQPAILSMGFLEASVKDLDVIDMVSLETQIKAFSQQSNLSPSNIVIIISANIIFEKDIPIIETEKLKEEIDKFIDTVPFDSVATKTFPIEKGIKVVGVNEGLCLAIKNSFEKLGSVVELIAPYQALGEDSVLINNLTVENCEMLLKKLDKLKQYNFLQVKLKEESAEASSSKDKNVPKKSNIRIFVMAGLLAVLLGILVYVMIANKII